MVQPGMVSVTFRSLTPSEIIKLTNKAKLSAIEWGSDVHVPVGDLETALEVARQSKDAGIETASYGSYYKPASPDNYSIEEYIETAQALGTSHIRIWAGEQGSGTTPESQRKKIVEDSKRIAEKGRKHGISFSFEFHANTLTDTLESAIKLIEEIGCPNINLYWQPFQTLPFNENLRILKNIIPLITNVHVFHWAANNDRFMLSEGENDWHEYFKIISQTSNKHYALLEFVKNEDQDIFLEDAKTLRMLLEEH